MDHRQSARALRCAQERPVGRLLEVPAAHHRGNAKASRSTGKGRLKVFARNLPSPIGRQVATEVIARIQIRVAMNAALHGLAGKSWTAVPGRTAIRRWTI